MLFLTESISSSTISEVDDVKDEFEHCNSQQSKEIIIESLRLFDNIGTCISIGEATDKNI